MHIEEFIEDVVCNDGRGGWHQLPWIDAATGKLHARWAKGTAATRARAGEIVASPERGEYYAINPFCSPIRRGDNVYALSNIAIDVDIHGAFEPWEINVMKDDLLLHLRSITEDGKSPLAPSLIIDSGHGIQAVWSLERSVPCGSPSLGSGPGQRLYDAVWHALAAWLDLQLRSLPYAVVDRAVVCDRARLMRMPDTVNRDQVSRVLVDNAVKHSLRALMSHLDKLKKSRIYLPASAAVNEVYGDLFLPQRLADIEHFVTAHRGAVLGHRNFLAHLYANSLVGIYGLDELQMQDEALDALNSMFSEPLSKNELASVAKSVRRFYRKNGRGYKYKRTTIAELLNLSDREAKKWFNGSSRREQERAARRLARRKRDEEIRFMAVAGHPQKEIAQKLGVSEATVSRIVRSGIKSSKLRSARRAYAQELAARKLLQAEISEALCISQATVSRDLAAVDIQNFIFDNELVVAARVSTIMAPGQPSASGVSVPAYPGSALATPRSGLRRGVRPGPHQRI